MSKEFQRYELTFSIEETSLTDSKIGRLPYLPVGEKPPVGESYGNQCPLLLVAQLNLEQLGGDLFPLKTGILQFWAIDDFSYGFNDETPTAQKGWRVVYYPNIGEHYSKEELAKFPELMQEAEEEFPIFPNVNFKITAKQTDTIFDVEEDEETPRQQIFSTPHFWESDPREEDDEFEDYILLLQLESYESDEDSSYEMAWGDCGNVHWFIHPDDLKKGDFSKVLMNFNG